MTAFGGNGSFVGGAGTVFFRNTNTGYTKLVVDNDRLATSVSFSEAFTNIGGGTWLTEPNVTQFHFNELELRGKGDLLIFPTAASNVCFFNLFCLSTMKC